jgi:hypothetical protein
LYAQVVKRLSPRNSSSLSRTLTSASSAAWCARSSNSGQQLVAPARQLAQCYAPQHLVQAGDGLVSPWVPDPKLLDPLSRLCVDIGLHRLNGR